MLAHTRTSLSLLTMSALALAACDDLPRPTVTDGRGERPRAKSAPSTGAPASSVPADTVTLRFAWPDQVDAQVSYSLTGSAVLGGGAETFTHAFSGRKVNGGWEVREEGPLEGAEYTSAELFLRGELLAPSLVTPDGAFSGVLDAAKVHEVGLSEMRARYERQGSLQLFEGGLGRMLTPAVVSRRSESIWRSMVGHWAGKTLTRGVGEEIRFSSPIGPASAAQQPLDLAGELRYVGPTRCTPREVEARCVALSLKVAADPDVMAKSVVESITNALPDGSSNRARVEEIVEVEQAAARREVTLVADPDTLLPYRVVINQVLDLTVSLQPDPSQPPKVQESKLDHKVERIFTYR